MSYKTTEQRDNYNRDYYLKNKKKHINYRKNNQVRDFGLFKRYTSLKHRCRFPSDKSYKYYGGRGIKLLWNTYEEFKKDMYKSYINHREKFGNKNTTIERIDVNGHYCKDNCKWATWEEQRKNKRSH